MESRVRALRPYQMTLDRGTDHYRVGVVWSIAGASAVVRVQCGPGAIRNFTVATADLPNASIGAPICARLVGDSLAAFTVAELIGTHWGAGGPGARERAAALNGEFHLAVIPRAITGDDDEYPWTKT